MWFNTGNTTMAGGSREVRSGSASAEAPARQARRAPGARWTAGLERAGWPVVVPLTWSVPALANPSACAPAPRPFFAP